jgi:hypothetical protein
VRACVRVWGVWVWEWVRDANTYISIASSTKGRGLESQWVKFKLFSGVPLFGPTLGEQN